MPFNPFRWLLFAAIELPRVAYLRAHNTKEGCFHVTQPLHLEWRKQQELFRQNERTFNGQPPQSIQYKRVQSTVARKKPSKQTACFISFTKPFCEWEIISFQWPMLKWAT